MLENSSHPEQFLNLKDCIIHYLLFLLLLLELFQSLQLYLNKIPFVTL
jgi:uncharacterized membrane protein (DUF373 family)